MSEALSILYVEDNEMEVELLTLCLQRYSIGTNVVLDVAETVEQAKQMFALEKHAGALIDWNLPDGEGTEVAQHIRAIHQTLPIVFLSGALTQSHLLEAEKYQPKACFEKDYSKAFIEKISDLVGNILDR